MPSLDGWVIEGGLPEFRRRVLRQKPYLEEGLMRTCLRLLWCCLIILPVVAGCSCDDQTSPAAVRGKITAKAGGISGQSDKVYSVVACDYDWSPGAPPDAIAGFHVTITSNDYSSTAVLDSLDANGGPTGVQKTFEPGNYSVVFFVSPQGSSPQYFAEVRLELKGNSTVSAPTWGQWASVP